MQKSDLQRLLLSGGQPPAVFEPYEEYSSDEEYNQDNNEGDGSIGTGTGNAQAPQPNEMANVCFYHPDHLGTSSFLTDTAGRPYQFFANLPFGETMAEQLGSNYNSPYKFNGKELDETTGLYYYGALYYDPKLSG